jgi:hypothetical protein
LNPYAVVAVFALFASALLCLFFLLFLKSKRPPTPRESDVRSTIAGVSAASACDIETLFSDDDYRMLSARPELKPLRLEIRRDRRRIALAWLTRLQREVHIVWEFRRFLAANHFAVTVGEEVEIGSTACLALLYLHVVWVIVFVCGPFALRGGLRRAGAPVRWLSSRAARLLARAPAAVRMQLEQKWAQHVLTRRPA